VDNKLSGIASIEEVSHEEGNWQTLRRLNGDQSNQGRQLSMAPHQVHLYRVILYTIDRSSSAPAPLCVNQPQCTNNESEMASPIAR